MLASAGTLPPALASSSPTTVPSVTWLMPTTSTTPKSRPRTTAITRWPRIVSTTESEASTPTSIITKRNSIRIAPV